ncbi:hypothetical protein [Pontibacter actiniarum]|nr:hypothetical protein [Pontibacter actiniarum]
MILFISKIEVFFDKLKGKGTNYGHEPQAKVQTLFPARRAHSF